jgi:transcriptional regulator with XRE-family HTH domain
MSEKQKAFFSYGPNIRDERKRIQKTQEEFAALGGVTVQTQRSYEAGRSAPSSQYLNRLAAAGVDVYYIISPTDDERRAVMLNPDEVGLIDGYRALTEEHRRLIRQTVFAWGVQAVEQGTHPRVRQRVKQKAKGHGNIQAGGDISGTVTDTPPKGIKKKKGG